MKTQKFSNLSHRKMCLEELRILYRQLLLLSRHNQLLCKRKYAIDQNLLHKNEKLQIVIKEKLKAVHKYIERMIELIKANRTKQNNLATLAVKKPITIITPENPIQKNRKSLYTKVTTDTTHWLKRTITPTLISPTIEACIKPGIQINKIRENNSQTTSLKKADQNNNNPKTTTSATTLENKHLQKNTNCPQNTLQKEIVNSPLNKVNAGIINLSQWLGKSTLTSVSASVSPSKSIKVKDAQTQTEINQTKEVQEMRDTEDAQVNMSYKEIEQSNQNLNTAESSNGQIDNIMHYDSGIHWCSNCNVFPATIHDYLSHLHSAQHSSLLLEKNVHEKPWQKNQTLEAFDANYYRNPKMQIAIEGVQFLVPFNGYYCKLCSEWTGDIECANNHLISYSHLKKYSTYKEKNPNWEIDWLMRRTLAYEQFIAANFSLGKNKTAVKVECCSPTTITNDRIELHHSHLIPPKKKRKAESILRSTSDCSSVSGSIIYETDHQIKSLVIPKNRKSYNKTSEEISMKKQKYGLYQIEYESSDININKTISKRYQKRNYLDKRYPSHSKTNCFYQIRRSRNCDHLRNQENSWSRRYESQEINNKNEEARNKPQQKLRKIDECQIRSRNIKDVTRNYEKHCFLETKYSYKVIDQMKSHGINDSIFYYSEDVKNKEHCLNYFKIQARNEQNHVKPIKVKREICHSGYKSDGECTTSSQE